MRDGFPKLRSQIFTSLIEILRSIGEVSEYSMARIVKAHEAKIKTIVSGKPWWSKISSVSVMWH